MLDVEIPENYRLIVERLSAQATRRKFGPPELEECYTCQRGRSCAIHPDLPLYHVTLVRLTFCDHCHEPKEGPWHKGKGETLDGALLLALQDFQQWKRAERDRQ